MLKKRVALIDALILKNVFSHIVKKFQFNASHNYQILIDIIKIMKTNLTLTKAHKMNIFKLKKFAQNYA